MTVADFWNQPEPDVERKGGRPQLVPEALEGREPVIRASYSRASGLAENIKDKTHIHTWEMRNLAKAMGQNEDLAALAAVETYTTGVETDHWGRPQIQEKRASGKRLDEIIVRAFDRVRLHEKADRGTTVHGATEPGAPALERLPERIRPPVAAYHATNRREMIEIVGTEMFTANDITMSAGTFDHMIRVHGHLLLTGLVVSDIKTGAFDPLSWAVQISSYARGKVYNTKTDRREEWPSEVNLDYGLVWQIDCKDYASADLPEPKERVKLWMVDLQVGWEMAQLAARVRDVTAEQNSLAGEYRSATFEQRLEASVTKEHLRMLWETLEDGDPRRDLITEKARSL